MLETKKPLILVVLSIAAVLSLWYGVVTPSKIKRDLSLTTPEGKNVFEAGEGDFVLSERSARRTGYEGWGRNPFSQAEAWSSGAQTNLKVSGIVWDEKRPQAVISNRIVGVGDVIEGKKVVAIKPSSVVVKDEVYYFELKLGKKR